MKELNMDFIHEPTLYFIFKIHNKGKICIVHSNIRKLSLFIQKSLIDNIILKIDYCFYITHVRIDAINFKNIFYEFIYLYDHV